VTRFIELAGEINTAMPRRVVEKTAAALSELSGRALKGARVLMLGVAYKKNVDDTRESPAFKIMEFLEQRGAVVDFHDPHLTVIPPTREHAHFAGRRSLPLSHEVLAGTDVAIICTDHDDVDYAQLAGRCRLIVDTRNACASRGLVGMHIVKA
jgi:UDP-N-acetyl-D-glucosamine dehydrogenase